MKVLILFIVLLSISASAAKKHQKTKHVTKKPSHSKAASHARAPTRSADFVTEERMEAINLEGLQILDADGFNELRYQFHPVTSVSKEEEDLIYKHSGNQVISQIFELKETAVFQHIYMYVAKANITPADVPYIPKSQYVLTELFVNYEGSSFCSRYYITAGNPNSLLLYRYKKDSPRTAKNPKGLFN